MSKADVMAGRAFVSLYMKDGPFVRGLQKAKSQAQAFGADMMALGAKIAAMSAAVAAPIGFATKTFSDFDDAMRSVGAASQATAAQLASMSATAKELGRTTSFTAVEVAKLMIELGRAGFNSDQVNAMTGAVLNLARATGTDATLSAGIMASTLRQFNLEATDAARVSDVLTLAANATFNSVEGLGESLKYAGPVAKELGLSLEDTVAVLGSLGNVGIQGSEAGTALRRLGVISAATGKDLKDIFNISNVDAAGNLKPLVQIMGEIGVAVEKMPVAERVTKMNDAFGLLGITSASVLSRAAGDTMKLAESLRHADGTAATTAASMDAGLGGALRIIMSAVEGLQIALGEALSGSIKGITETITGLIGKATEWVTLNQGAVVSIAAMTAAVAAAGSAIIAMGVGAKVAAVGLGLLTTAVVIAKAAILGVMAVGPVVAILGSLAAAAAVVTVAGTDLSGAWGIVTGTLSNLMEVAKRVGGILMSALAEGDYDIAFGAAMAGVKLALANAIDGMTSLWSSFWSGAWNMTKRFFSNFANITYKIISAIAKAISNPLQAASAIKGALGDIMSGKISFGIDTESMKSNASAELDRLEKELEARKSKREAERKAKEAADAATQTAAAPGVAPAAGGDGEPFGAMNLAQVDAEDVADKATSAFDRETEALQRQIIALREGEDAAERFRLKKEGLADAQIEQIMQLRAEEAALRKKKDEAAKAVGESDSGSQFTVKAGGASAATFSAQQLQSLGSGSIQSQAMQKTTDAVKAQTTKLAEKLDVIAMALKNAGLIHA